MAASITPKSEARQIHNLRVGYGEIPTTTIEGRPAWALPGEAFTFSKRRALAAARELDQRIRRNLSHPDRPVLI